MLEQLERLLFEVKSKQEKLIIKTMIDNFDDLVSLKLDDVANLCFCSTTSVRRVIIKLGYKGYLEYQLYLKLEDKKKSLPDKDTSELSMNHLKMLEFLTTGKLVYIFSKGSSLVCSHYLFRQLISRGYEVIVIPDIEMLHLLKDKKVLVISNSGSSPNIINMVDLMIANDCEVASITLKDSLLYKKSSICITHDGDNKQKYDDPTDLLIQINKLLEFF